MDQRDKAVTMDATILKKQLHDEGFAHVYEWHDDPGTEYPPHAHQDKVSFYITDGSMNFHIGGVDMYFEKGDRFDVPPKTEHKAKVGPDGCTFVVGEMVEGDS